LEPISSSCRREHGRRNVIGTNGRKSSSTCSKARSSESLCIHASIALPVETTVAGTREPMLVMALSGWELSTLST